jgi:hypothetical protein
MTAPCPHAVVDYQYATWHKCRACGAMLQRVETVAGRSAKPDVAVPFSLLEFPARTHARGSERDEW